MLKYLLLIVAGMTFSLEKTYGQNQTAIDSILLLLENKTGNDRYFPFVEIAIEYVDHDNEKALTYIREAEKVALFSRDSLWIVKSRRIRVQILLKLERFKEAIDLGDPSVRMAVRIDARRELLFLTQALGFIQLVYGRYDKALQSCFETQKLATNLADTSLIALSLRGIGVTYYKLKAYDKALVYHKNALHFSDSTDPGIQGAFINLSLCYTYLNDLANAKKYVLEGLKLCGKDCDKISLLHIKYTLGCIALRSKQYDKAENEFMGSYELSREVSDHRMQFDNIYYLTEIYLHQNATEKAIFYLAEAEKNMDKAPHFNLERLKIYSRLYEVYFLLNDYEKVAGYQRKYINLRDSIYDEALTTNLMKIESDFHQRENVKTISEQNDVLLLKEEMIKDQRMLNIVTVLLALITASFLLLVFRSLKQKKQLNHLLDKKIGERTVELQLSRNQLLASLAERDIMIERASEEINETIGTIKGLCLITCREIDEPRLKPFIEKIDRTASGLNGHLKAIFPSQIVLAFLELDLRKTNNLATKAQRNTLI